MGNDNIFSALARYNSAVDENYLTEAFIFIINSLLERDRQTGCELLTQLCVNNSEFRFDTCENISVSTQEATELGTPDIRILTPDKLIYIEVKHDSPLGYQQVVRYKKALESSSAPIKHVVLLTRFPIDFKDETERPYKHIRWFEVYNRLSAAKSKTSDAISLYLLESFNAFLEAKQMSIQKVGWEYINGVPAMMNLVNMIEVAIQGAGIHLYPGYPRAVALEWRGFYLGSNDLWCGIWYGDHLKVFLQMVDKKKFDTKLLPNPTYPMDEEKKSLWFYMPLEDHHFFSLDKDEQLELLTKFIKTSYAEANKMRREKI